MSRRAGSFPINGRMFTSQAQSQSPPQSQSQDGAAAAVAAVANPSPSPSAPRPGGADVADYHQYYRWEPREPTFVEENAEERHFGPPRRRMTSPTASPERASADFEDEPHSQPLPLGDSVANLEYPYYAARPRDPHISAASYLPHYHQQPYQQQQHQDYYRYSRLTPISAPYQQAFGSQQRSRPIALPYAYSDVGDEDDGSDRREPYSQNPAATGYAWPPSAPAYPPPPPPLPLPEPPNLFSPSPVARRRIRISAPPPPPAEPQSGSRLNWFQRERSDQGAPQPPWVTTIDPFRAVVPYTFVPPGSRQQDTTGAADLLSDSESPLPDEHPENLPGHGGGADAAAGRADSDVAAAAAASDRATQVYRSLYTGDGYYDGSHSALLSVLNDPKRSMKPLFRWLHLQQQPVMDLDELSSEISRLRFSLSEAQRAAVSDTLGYVRKHYVKSRQLSKGTVRYMDPAIFQNPNAKSGGGGGGGAAAAAFPDGAGPTNPRVSAASQATSGGSSEANRTSSVLWLCLPYFFLDRYSGLAAGEGRSGSFPPLTLLQAQYSGNSRERDMMQAVCRVGNVPPGWCYHIGQLWALVIDDAVLVTCGAMSEIALRGDSIKIGPEMMRQPSGISSSSSTVISESHDIHTEKIFVEWGASFLWAIPVKECSTWFAFIRHFREFWPLQFRFMYRNRSIRPVQWHKILRHTRKAKSNMVLTMHISPAPKPFAPGILIKLEGKADIGPTSETAAAAQLSPPREGNKSRDGGGNGGGRAGAGAGAGAKVGGADRPREAFHVFTWKAGCKPTELKDAALLLMMNEIDVFLNRDAGSHDGRLYRNAGASTRAQVYAHLSQQQEGSGSDVEGFEYRVDLFNSADLVFQFFLPPEADQLPSCAQFWGSIMMLVQGQQSPRSARAPADRSGGAGAASAAPILADVARRLEALAGTFHVFRWMLKFADDDARASVDVPDQLARAWLHVVMGLVYATVWSYGDLLDIWAQHIDIADGYMQDGMRAVLDRLAGRALLDYAVVRPTELLGLAGLALLSDAVGPYPDVTDTYEAYLKSLESDISARASPSHQYRLNNVRSEIAIVKHTRASQLSLVQCLRSACSAASSQRFIPASSDWARPSRPGQETKSGGPAPAPPPPPPPDYQPYYFSYPLSGGAGIPQGYDRMVSGGGAAAADAASAAPPPAPLDEYNRLSSTNPGGLRDLFLSDGALMLERKVRDFEEFWGQTRLLEQANTARLDVTRDRQERATYAFTVVTIIFLPLSAVASVFGINTTDIRDMNYAQWLYWAVALPVTVLVIIVGLWWMGELWALVEWGLRGIGLRKGDRWRGGGADGGGFWPGANGAGAQQQQKPREAMAATAAANATARTDRGGVDPTAIAETAGERPARSSTGISVSSSTTKSRIRRRRGSIGRAPPPTVTVKDEEEVGDNDDDDNRDGHDRDRDDRHVPLSAAAADRRRGGGRGVGDVGMQPVAGPRRDRLAAEDRRRAAPDGRIQDEVERAFENERQEQMARQVVDRLRRSRDRTRQELEVLRLEVERNRIWLGRQREMQTRGKPPIDKQEGGRERDGGEGRYQRDRGESGGDRMDRGWRGRGEKSSRTDWGRERDRDRDMDRRTAFAEGGAPAGEDADNGGWGRRRGRSARSVMAEIGEDGAGTGTGAGDVEEGRRESWHNFEDNRQWYEENGIEAVAGRERGAAENEEEEEDGKKPRQDDSDDSDEENRGRDGEERRTRADEKRPMRNASTEKRAL